MPRATQALRGAVSFGFERGLDDLRDVVDEVNLDLRAHFGGERNDAGMPDEKIDFTYTARLMYEASKNISWAVEAYGTIDRIGGTGTKSDEAALFGDHNQHRIGPVLYWTRELEGVAASPFRPMVDSNDVSDEAENPSLVFGVGVLLGLNENTPDTTLKLSIEALF